MGLLSRDALLTLAMAVAIFLFLVDLMHWRQCWAARYPPGPMPLPGLGNLLHVDFYNTPYSFYKVRSHFGDMFRLQLAWRPVVVLNGLAAVQEAWVNGHTRNTCSVVLVSLYSGVVMAPYEASWKEQRRFSVSTLRNFGLGKKSLEQWVIEEADCLCAAFTDQAGRPFRPNALLNKAVCNVIASLIYALRFEYDDPRLVRLLDLLEENMKEESGILPELLNAVPVLLRIPGLPGKVFPGQKAFFVLLDELLTEHRMTWDPAQPPRDLTDAFLAEVEKAKGNQPESSFNDENLRMVVADLFAGWEDKGGQVAPGPWLVGTPVAPSRVQQEIDEVIGQVRRPEMGDQARMPFTNAVIHEVQRFGDIMLVGVPHVTFHDVEGTTLITNLSSVLKDETVWEKPFRFHPEHFLDAQGHFVKPEVFMPFSAGHRVCLGEPLGRMELFLFFTRLLQRLSFSVPAGHPRPSDYGAFAVPVSPSPYELCVASR
uniref:Cytochrome P450 n=1 Tax=Castor canadensis TaxID=51338 RepID=A0A8C0XRL9_CASCN